MTDSQSVKGATTVSKASHGFDPAKMINGRKRHVAVDAKGHPVVIMVTPADIQDRDAARELLWRLRLTHPQITQGWADSAYAGQLVTWAADFLHITLKTVSHPKGAKGFVVLPLRWRVERTLGWIMNAFADATAIAS
ncbi:transposase [Streptomyces chartreusis]|uniref:transposase n=1 Tax=Streptomyces chartreusis TaxID=1969 RepID=UPI00369E25EC